jgi:type II secretory pathway component PulF
MSQTSSTPFLFVASKPGGGRSIGVRNARTAHQLADTLRKERLLLQQSYALPKWAGKEEEFSLKDSVVLNEQLAALLSRGVPLVEALDVTASTVAPSSRALVTKLRDQVSGGSSFSEACAKAGAFDAVTVAVYRAAERTGDLAGSARELATTARRMLSIATKAQTVAIYPAIVAAVGVAVGAGMVTFVVPALAEHLQDATGGKLPWFTTLLATVGGFVRENLIYVVLLLLIAAVTLFALRKQVFAWLWKLVRRVPVMRDVILAQESARFFGVMSAMTKAGVPIADALTTANQAIHHPQLRSQMDKLRTRLVEGGQMRQLIEQVDALPLATRRLLVAAERAGDLEAAFASLATDMTEEVDRKSQRALAVLQPAMIVLLFLFIGSLLLAILIPLLTIASNVRS